MKIICVDNFGNRAVPDTLIAENVSENYGKFIVTCLKGPHSGNSSILFFKLVDDDYKLYKFEEGGVSIKDEAPIVFCVECIHLESDKRFPPNYDCIHPGNFKVVKGIHGWFSKSSDKKECVQSPSCLNTHNSCVWYQERESK